MNEKMQILKLLEEGKINAEEASRLLEALSHPATGHRGHPRMWAAFEQIPEHIATMINGSALHMASAEKLSFDAKDQISIKGISGNMTIKVADQNKITVNKQGFSRVKEKDDHIEIKAISGDIDVQMPKDTKLVIKGVAGSITISGVESEIMLKTVSGNVIGDNLKGTFSGDFVSGDIELEYIDIDKMDIRSRSGDITLYLDDKIDAHINVETEEGNIECDIPLINEKKDEFSLQGDLNKGKGQIHIKCDLGDTILKKRESRKKDQEE